MKTWINRSLIALFGAVIVLGGLSACGNRHDRDRMGGEYEGKFQARIVERVTEDLALNEAQKQRLVVLGDRGDGRFLRQPGRRAAAETA